MPHEPPHASQAPPVPHLDHLNVRDTELIGVGLKESGQQCAHTMAVNDSTSITQLVRLQVRVIHIWSGYKKGSHDISLPKPTMKDSHKYRAALGQLWTKNQSYRRSKEIKRKTIVGSVTLPTSIKEKEAPRHIK